MSQPILEVRGLSRSFGGIAAVKDVSFAIAAGEIVGLVGPNGAGKTTLVNLVSGMIKPSGGSVVFDGEDVTRRPPHEIARRGLSRTFQIVQPFAGMTVLENVMAGALFAGGIADRRAAAEAAREHLAFTGLAAFADYHASDLSLANRKRLEFAKSIAMRPKLLLLDEVNAGLNSGETGEALTLIRSIAARGVTIMVIEHRIPIITALAGRVLVLHHGSLLAEGAPDAVFNDPRVIEAYLGSRFSQRMAASRA